MAGRFLYQRLTSRISESTRLHSARASSAASARDVVNRHVSEGRIGGLFHGGATARPAATTDVLGINVYGGCIRTLGYLIHGAVSEQPSRGIRITNMAPRCYYSTWGWRADAAADGTGESNLDTATIQRHKPWDKAEKKGTTNGIAALEAELDRQERAFMSSFEAFKAKQEKRDNEFLFIFTFLLCCAGFLIVRGMLKIIFMDEDQNGGGRNSKVAAASSNTTSAESGCDL